MYKFYVSIAEALKGCPDYIEWILPYIATVTMFVPSALVKEGIQQEEENSSSTSNYASAGASAATVATIATIATGTTTTVEQRTSTGPGDDEEKQYICMNRDYLTFKLAVSVVEESANISDVTGDNVLTAFVTGTHNRTNLKYLGILTILSGAS